MFKPLTALFVVALLIANATTLSAQNNVGIGTTTPNASAALEVQSTTQGMLVPRMTSAQRTAIATPATGLLVYQTDGTAGFYFYNGTAWTSLNSGGSSGDNLGNHTATQDLSMGSKNITSVNTITVDKLNIIKDISIGTQKTIYLNSLNATSAEIDATGASYIYLTTNINSTSHVIHGIAGGYNGKILYLAMDGGFTWFANTAGNAETTVTNRLQATVLVPWTRILSVDNHFMILIYMNNRWNPVVQTL